MTDAAVAAAPSDTGSTLLTSGIPASPPPAAPPAEGAAAAVKDAMDGPPEWAPAKYWDPEKKALRVEDLGKGYKNLESLLGKDRIPVPNGDEDEEGWQRWYQAAGRPEKPEEYDFKRPDLPEGMPYDDDTEKAFRTWAHINGLSKKQAQNLFDGYAKTQMERHVAYATTQKQAVATAEQALRREYGNQYEQAVAQAKSALATYADPDYIKHLEETGQGNDPRVIRAWIKVGKEMGGDTKLAGAVQAKPQAQDIDKAIGEFRGKYEKELMTREHPRHDWAVQEYNKLFQARYGDQ